MNLYHFTSVTMAESILASGLSNGHLMRANGSIERPVVWLTSDQSHEGHGLLTGAEKMTERHRDYTERATGRRPTNDFIVDKTRVRIKMRVQSTDRRLTSYVKYCVSNGDGRRYAKLIGLSGYNNLHNLDEDVIRELLNKTKTKEETWFLYHGTILPSQIIDLDYRTDVGFVPYDFEAHGRSQMIFDGVVPVSAAATEQLQKLFKPRFPLDRISATTLCSTPNQAPMVVVRGCSEQVLIDIVREKFLQGELPANADSVLDWIKDHKDELMQSYQVARERFFFSTCLPCSLKRL